MSEWKRSTYCGTGSCVEVKYVRSSACADTNCVEAAPVADEIWVRDSKCPAEPPLRFTREEWDAFLEGVRRKEFDFNE